MTVKELIKELGQHHGYLEVVVSFGLHGYTSIYGLYETKNKDICLLAED